jgi:hypothetical protein
MADLSRSFVKTNVFGASAVTMKTPLPPAGLLRRFLPLSILAMFFAAPLSARVEDSASDLGQGWRRSAWMGDFYEAGDGWLWQENWGWMYEVDGGTDALWFYASGENGWYWADGAYYPFLYRYAASAWVWFWPETSDPRLYYDYGSSGWTASDASDGALWRRYFLSILDAEEAEYSEIRGNLTAVNQYNDALPWNDSHTMIYVASWMGGKYISSYVPGQPLTPSWRMWVTVAGQAQDFAYGSGLSGGALTLRMKELIGLPPDAEEEYWVEFLVRPEDLLRPSPDPDPSDSQAQLDFPSSPEMSVDAAYREWFAGNAAASYILTRNGYPWTRLGYTYDWAEGSDEVGLSEFIIRPGSTVLVTGVWTNEQYLEAR